MVRRVLHLLLVTAIVLCPIGCGPGLCALGGGCDLASDCSADCQGHCHQEDSHQKEHAPPPADHEPCDHNPCEGRCQCICGGAILPGAAEFDLVPQLNPAADSPVTGDGNLLALTACRADFDQTEVDDGSPLSGRVIRCLHSSLLC